MKRFINVLLVFALLLIIVGCGTKTTDAERFKLEYESLNGTTRLKDGKKIKSISISKNNPMKYASYDEVLDVIKKGTGIIYLGFPDCPWCRSALPVLLESAKDYKIDTIYYINMENERDYYEVKDGKVVYQKDENGNLIKGTKGYFKLLKALDKELDEYIVKDDKGKEYKVGEKRIYVPLIVFVNNGNIIGTHTSTVDTQENGYDDLTDDEYDKLSGIYADYIKELVDNYCDESC